ncbi:MAG: SEC-C domain-containing protein [Bacteroidales bacterium]|nr:SEC-C domain-containing protein [Bacteroidales bacterium]
MIATLWGSVYLYDFLYAYHIIDEVVYKQFIENSRHIKAMVFARYTRSLWMAGFIHQWVKPNTVAEDEYKVEQKIFRKTFYVKYISISEFEEKFSEELRELDEDIKDKILDTKASDEKRYSWMDELLLKEDDDLDLFKDEEDFEYDGDLDDYDDELQFPNPEDRQPRLYQPEFYQQPIKSPRKIGRNEPCPCDSGKKYKKCCMNKDKEG